MRAVIVLLAVYVQLVSSAELPPVNPGQCRAGAPLEYLLDGRSFYAADNPGYSMNFVTAEGENRPACCAVQDAFVRDYIRDITGLNQFAMAFGQFSLSHDVALTTDGHDVFEPAPDDFLKGTEAERETCLPRFRRSRFSMSPDGEPTDPLLHPNEITGCIDASNVYGSSTAFVEALRQPDTPFLRESPRGGFPPLGCPDPTVRMANPFGKPLNELACTGDIRGSENALLLTFHTIFLREHNRLAEKYQRQNPGMSADAIFDMARAMVIAIMQKIVFYDYGEALVGPRFFKENPYVGVNAGESTAVFAEFSQAVFRVPHAQISGTLRLIEEKQNTFELEKFRVGDFIFRPEAVMSRGLEPFVLGMVEEPALRIGTNLDPDVAGGELAAVDCARGRDFGLPTYNEVHEYLFGTKLTSLSQITSDVRTDDVIRRAYCPPLDINLPGPGQSYSTQDKDTCESIDSDGNGISDLVDNLDLYVGTLAEDHEHDVDDDGTLRTLPVGKVFRAVFEKQLLKLRDSDPSWFENPDYTAITDAQRREVRETTLTDLVLRNTALDCMQENAFFTRAHSRLVCKDRASVPLVWKGDDDQFLRNWTPGASTPFF